MAINGRDKFYLRAAQLGARWQSWQRRALELERETRFLWADYEALICESTLLKTQANHLLLDNVTLPEFGELPDQLAEVRSGRGAMRWRPKP